MDEEIDAIARHGLVQATQALDGPLAGHRHQALAVREKTGLKELSKEYSVSMEHIRQIKARTFEKMQPYLAAA